MEQTTISTQDLLGMISGEQPPRQEPTQLIEKTSDDSQDLVKTTQDLLTDISKDSDSTKDNEPDSQEGKSDEGITDFLSKKTVNAIKLAIKDGLLEPIVDVVDGNEVEVEYKTQKDFIDLIVANKEKWKGNSVEQVKEEFYNSMSPTWKTVLEYSENVRDISELSSLLQSISNQEYSNSLNIEDPSDQIKVITNVLTIQGLSQEAIELELQDLEERGKVSERAKALKPVLDNYNNNRVQQELELKKINDMKINEYWSSYYSDLDKSILKAKDISGININETDKRSTIQYIIPNKQIGGVPLYSLIDNLFENKKVDTLFKIAMIASDEAKFNSYFIQSQRQAVSSELTRALKGSQRSTPTDIPQSTSSTSGLKRLNYSSR